MLDLLVFSFCSHFSKNNFKKAIENGVFENLENRSQCWVKLRKLLLAENIDSNKNIKIKISNRSFSLLEKVCVSIMNKEERLDLIFIIYRGFTKLMKSNIIKVFKLDSKIDECKFSGRHSTEYTELCVAYDESIKNCDLICGIFCIGRIFTIDHLNKIANKYRKKIKINRIVTKNSVEIVEVEKDKIMITI